jgi:hypothetical protein
MSSMAQVGFDTGEPLGSHSPGSVLLAMAGPVAVGAVLGGERGLFAAAHVALGLPVVIGGLTAAMMPALYIGLAVTGAAPSAAGVALATGRGLRAMGLALLGVVAPLLFLLATVQDSRMAIALGSLVVGGAAFAGLRALHRALFGAAGPARAQAVMLVWSLLALGIGARLFAEVVSL